MDLPDDIRPILARYGWCAEEILAASAKEDGSGIADRITSGPILQPTIRKFHTGGKRDRGKEEAWSAIVQRARKTRRENLDRFGLAAKILHGDLHLTTTNNTAP